VPLVKQEMITDTKGAMIIRKSKKARQYNGQKKKDKQRSIKHYTENDTPSNTNPTRNVD
jgi:hypothetical protein